MPVKQDINRFVTLLLILSSSSALSIQNTPNSSTLPTHLTRRALQQHIATELGWLPNADPAQICGGLYQIPQYLQENPKVDDKAPIHITTAGPEILRFNGVSELKNKVVISQPGRLIYADKAFIFRQRTSKKISKISLVGHVRIYQPNSLLVSDSAIVTLHPRSVDIRRSAYHYYSEASYTSTIKGPFNAWGIAEHGQQNAAKVITLHHATYSTCPPSSSPVWQVSASKLTLDKIHNVGNAYNAILKINNIPIFYSPFYHFQLNNERKSGFLMPVFGHIGDAGYYVGLPYYLNLAPNYDLLLTPQYYGQRGFRGVGKFRYLTEHSLGIITANYLPDDRVFAAFRSQAFSTYSNTTLYPSATYQPYLNELNRENNQRAAFSLSHTNEFNEDWSSRLYLNWVSDPYYFMDIAAPTNGFASTTNQLLNLLQLHYNTSYWDASGSWQDYQTLHMIDQIQRTSQGLDQYQRLPQLNAVGYFPLSSNLDFELDSDYNDFFYHNFLFTNAPPQGQRLHIRPGLSWQLENNGAYINPQLWLDAVGYDLNTTVPGIAKTSQRTLPIVDIDSGLYFVRNFSWGNNAYQQTLEPRLFYLYVPYTNQNNLPIFDTFQLPFFYHQIFALNTFESIDRLENANQFSVGITSDISNSTSGATLLSANLGEIYYVTTPQVCLIPNCNLLNRNLSPLTGSITINPSTPWSLTNSVAWDPKQNTLNNATTTLSYHQEGNRIVNFSYLYVGANQPVLSNFSLLQPNTINNFTNSTSYLSASAAWPVAHQWSLLGATTYNANLERFDTIYMGLQYDTCCWAIRFIINRLFNGSTLTPAGTLQNTFNTGYFIEFTLKGLASFGSGSNTFIQNLVPGYKS